MKAHTQYPSLYIVDHPLVQHKLSLMRDEACSTADFRRLLKEISLLMGYEVTRHLPLRTKTIKTPMQEMSAPILDGPQPVIIPVLRAGLGMSEGLVELIPDCQIGHIGLYRDEETHRPKEYLVRLPDICGQMFILTDPMLATGYSGVHAIDTLVSRGVPTENILFMCLVAAPEGVSVVMDKYPRIRVYTASLDERLNENAYILPGLGDAGDRLFGTL